jgi:hypothetical protein
MRRRILILLRYFALEHVHLRFRRHSLRKGQSCRPAIEREPRQSLLLPRREDPQVRTLENRTAQSRMPPRWSYALRAIPRTAPCREFRFLTIWVSVLVLLLLCQRKIETIVRGQTCASKKVVECSISITERRPTRRRLMDQKRFRLSPHRTCC